MESLAIREIQVKIIKFYFILIKFFFLKDDTQLLSVGDDGLECTVYYTTGDNVNHYISGG